MYVVSTKMTSHDTENVTDFIVLKLCKGDIEVVGQGFALTRISVVGHSP